MVLRLRTDEAELYAASASAGKTLQGTAQQRFSSPRDGFRFGTTPSAAQRTKRTQAHRNVMFGHTTVDVRKTSVGGASEHERQYCRSLHETSGWTEKLGLRTLEDTNGDD